MPKILESRDEVPRAAWHIEEWCRAAGVGRTLTYKLLREGRIAARKLGARTLITTDPADFVASLAPLDLRPRRGRPPAGRGADAPAPLPRAAAPREEN